MLHDSANEMELKRHLFHPLKEAKIKIIGDVCQVKYMNQKKLTAVNVRKQFKHLLKL